MILACSGCSHKFVSIFTVTIDWVDGDDPQSWALLPLTSAEAAGLLERGDSLTETELGALGPGRRCLMRDRPKAAAERIYWASGIFVGPHD